MFRFAALLVSSVLLAGCVAAPIATPAKAPGARSQASACIDNPSACLDKAR